MIYVRRQFRAALNRAAVFSRTTSGVVYIAEYDDVSPFVPVFVVSDHQPPLSRFFGERETFITGHVYRLSSTLPTATINTTADAPIIADRG